MRILENLYSEDLSNHPLQHHATLPSGTNFVYSLGHLEPGIVTGGNDIERDFVSVFACKNVEIDLVWLWSFCNDLEKSRADEVF